MKPWGGGRNAHNNMVQNQSLLPESQSPLLRFMGFPFEHFFLHLLEFLLAPLYFKEISKFCEF